MGSKFIKSANSSEDNVELSFSNGNTLIWGIKKYDLALIEIKF